MQQQTRGLINAGGVNFDRAHSAAICTLGTPLLQSLETPLYSACCFIRIACFNHIGEGRKQMLPLCELLLCLGYLYACTVH